MSRSTLHVRRRCQQRVIISSSCNSSGIISRSYITTSSNNTTSCIRIYVIIINSNGNTNISINIYKNGKKSNATVSSSFSVHAPAPPSIVVTMTCTNSIVVISARSALKKKKAVSVGDIHDIHARTVVIGDATYNDTNDENSNSVTLSGLSSLLRLTIHDHNMYCANKTTTETMDLSSSTAISVNGGGAYDTCSANKGRKL